MSVFDLQKRQETIKFVLDKRALKTTPVMRVGVALDVSGSAQPLYKNGTMQATIDRLVPVAMRFDDNGEMDVWSFDNNHNQLDSVGKMDYEDYIKREILANNDISKWGSTRYAGVMEAMVGFYFGAQGRPAPATRGGFFGSLFGGKASPAPVAKASTAPLQPAMVLFITDGANDDRAAAEKVLRNSQSQSLYWQLVGVGNPREFGFLKEMADELPNAGFVHLSNLKITDEALYDQLLSEELCSFIKDL
jgi:hypothetical protein